MRPLFTATLLLLGFTAASQETAKAQAPAPAEPDQHPALFLVGDSTMKTGTNGGIKGPWGWGYEIIPLFDASRIHVYNEGRGGRSSRGYIAEGAWASVLARIQSGDYVILQFGHNDSANSQNYPDRVSAKGNGDETQVIASPVDGKKESIHTYGWYLRKYIEDAKAKGATVIVCSPVPRDAWVAGKIKRGFDGYAGWAKEAAAQGGAFFIDLNSLSADRFDALGQEQAARDYNDFQHTTKAGARLNAQAVVAGIKNLKDCPLAGDLAGGN